MVSSFVRRRNLHPLNLMIDSDPKKAEAEIINAYKKGGYTQKGAADVLECHETTLIRWVHKLDLWQKLDAIKGEAVKKGLVSAARRPARA